MKKIRKIFIVCLFLFSLIIFSLIIYLILPEKELRLNNIDFFLLSKDKDKEEKTFSENMTLNQGYENILCVEFMFEWQHEFYTKHSILKGSENIVLDEIKEIKFSLTVSKERISIDSFFIKSPDFEDFRFKDHYII